MEKWRKKLSVGLLSAALLALTPSVASADSCDPCCDPCDWSLCDLGGFGVGVDFLWWKPCVDDMDYAFTREVDTHTHVKYHGICPDWEPGVRVFLTLPEFFCDWTLSGSWTWISACDSSSVSSHDGELINSPLLHQVFGVPGFSHAKGSYDLDYHDWDVLLSYNLCNTGCHEFSPFFGVAGLILDQEQKVDLHDNEDLFGADRAHVKWNSDLWGVGLRAGTHYEYRFNDCMKVFARAEGTLLAGESDGTNKQYYIDTDESALRTDYSFKDGEHCHCIPGYHLTAGMIYETCVCDYEFALRLGYEFVHWHNIPNPRVFVGDDSSADLAHSTSRSTRDVAFHGLLAGVSFGF